MLACACAQAAAERPLQVVVFFSKEDPRWPDAERVIDDSIRPFAARVAVEKVCFDDPAGYARLTRIEKDLPVEQPGEVTVAVGNFALTSTGAERRDVENYLAPVLARMLGGVELKTRRATAVLAYAREAFRRADVAVEKDHEKLGGVYFRVSAGGALLGWVVDAYRTIQCPVCYDAQFLVAAAAAPNVRILGVRPVRELELYGKPLPGERATAFLRQFDGRRPGATARVDAVVGATKTSRAYERAVAEILQELQLQAATREKGEQRADGRKG